MICLSLYIYTLKSHYNLFSCAALANRLDVFHLLLSSEGGLKALKSGVEKLDPGKRWSVFIELDAGYGRSE